MTIIIRCDAAELPEIGTGHVVRMKALAAALLQQGKDVRFLSCQYTVFTIANRLLEGYKLLAVDADEALTPDTPSEAQTIIDCAPELVIFDRLQTCKSTIKALKDAGIKVVSLDDNGDGSLYTDVTINSLVPSLECEATNVLEGYKYLIRQCVDVPSSLRKKKKIVASFGGFDAKRLTEALVNQMDFEQWSAYHFDFIVGSEVYQRELEALVKEKSLQNVEIVCRPDDFYVRLAESELAIVSGGLTLFDAVALAVPSVALAQYEHQTYNIKKLAALGLTAPCSAERDINMVLQNALNSDMSKALDEQKVIDDGGLRRVLRILEDKVKL